MPWIPTAITVLDSPRSSRASRNWTSRRSMYTPIATRGWVTNGPPFRCPMAFIQRGVAPHHRVGVRRGADIGKGRD
jgi:hypothetical protein